MRGITIYFYCIVSSLALLALPACKHSDPERDSKEGLRQGALEGHEQAPQTRSPAKSLENKLGRVLDKASKRGFDKASPLVRDAIAKLPNLDAKAWDKLVDDRECSQLLDNVTSVSDTIHSADSGSKHLGRRSSLEAGLILLGMGALGAGLAVGISGKSLPGKALSGLVGAGIPLALSALGAALVQGYQPRKEQLELIGGLIPLSGVAISLGYVARTLGWLGVEEARDIDIAKLISSLERPQWYLPAKGEKEEALGIVQDHIKERFDKLDEIAAAAQEKGTKLRITVAGGPRFGKAREHQLGTGLAKGQWANRYGGDEKVNQGLIEYTQERYDALKKKYKDSKHVTVELGAVDGKNASADHYQVWGAHAGNWNYKESDNPGTFGGGQAQFFDKQKPGVFGIVTTPLAGLQALTKDQNQNTAKAFLDSLGLNKNSFEYEFLEEERLMIDQNFRTVTRFMLASELYIHGGISDPSTLFKDNPSYEEMHKTFLQHFRTYEPKIRQRIKYSLGSKPHAKKWQKVALSSVGGIMGIVATIAAKNALSLSLTESREAFEDSATHHLAADLKALLRECKRFEGV